MENVTEEMGKEEWENQVSIKSIPDNSEDASFKGKL